MTNDDRIVRTWPVPSLGSLFAVRPRGRPPALDLTYRPSSPEHSWYRFRGPEALTTSEQTVLLALLEIAQQRCLRDLAAAHLGPTSADRVGRQLWAALYRGQAQADASPVLRFRTSWSELSARCGTSDGGAVLRLRQAQVQRLCEVVVWEYAPGSSVPRHQSQLLAWCHGTEDGVHLALNFGMVRAVLGERYASVSLAERLSLAGDCAQAAHAYLSTLLRGSRSLRIGVDTLAARIWPGQTPPPQGTRRRRRADLRSALASIGALSGWRVLSDDGEVYAVRRRAPQPGPIAADAAAEGRRHGGSAEPSSDAGLPSVVADTASLAHLAAAFADGEEAFAK